ncbi:hypothetical protein J1TS5_04260 [Paenibacillus macerans]|uniref:transcription termination/antitermination NusG family protein n=1 Tax=Paenibacillus macerans TaxID=44252 RepID=UPI001B2E1AF8|nr:transcription termination/antitermination NusG family protein [Paenibacillus macerans]GIP08256.1 hypothetical protein J1TS5_04260 [Paenibacillus macerans]
MGAAFAIQVMTGKENNVKKLMDWAFSRNENAIKWIKAVHTFTQSTRRLLSEGKMGKEIKRAVMPGYIFVEMNYSVEDNNQTAYLPADLWHLIKSVPGVLKQFTGAGQIIGADEFQKMLGIDVEELVEVTVPVEDFVSEASHVDQVEKNVKTALHKVNTANTMKERKQALEELDTVEVREHQMVSVGYQEPSGEVTRRVEELQAASGNHKWLSKIKIFLRHKKEKVRFPKLLLDKIIDHIDFQCKPDPRFIVSRLLKFLQKEVNLN